MKRWWNWLCVGVTIFLLVACASAFAHLYSSFGDVHNEPDEPGWLSKIGYLIGEPLFETAEKIPGLDYAVILNHPVLFAIGLGSTILGSGACLWYSGVLIMRFCRRRASGA